MITLKQLYQKAFVGGQWCVGYRLMGAREYKIIETPNGMWIADPMLFSADGEHYLFAEIYETQKGKAAIGYFQFENDVPVYKGLIVECPYHMSYPCVFQFNGQYYMIPETSAGNCISLYRAERFPDKWVKEADLLHGEKYVDTTVYSDGEEMYVVSYVSVKNGWQLVQFALDMEQKVLTKQNVIDYHDNTGRPAGYIFDGNKRPAQDCKRKYGENLLLYEVDSFHPFSEHLCRTITVKDITTNNKFTRVHTYSTDNTYEAVDLFREKFDLLHGLKIFIRMYRPSLKGDVSPKGR